MGLKLQRKKKKNILLSLVYRASRLLPFSKPRKLKLFLNLEWIFERLSHETSFEIYSNEKHPLRSFSLEFLIQFIEPNYSVIDLGCKYGEISYYISYKAKKVIGIDFDKVAIEKAQSIHQNNNLSFKVGDALVFLNNSKEKFDVVILSHILEHIDKPEELLMHLKEYVSYLYVEVPDFDKSYHNHYRKDLGCDLIYTDPDHISEFDRKDLIELFNRCNMQIKSSEYRFGVQRYWLKTTSN